MSGPSDRPPAAPAHRRPRTPLLTVDGVVLWGPAAAGPPERVLLVQRRHPPFQGSWVLPGGFVEVGEDLPAAVAREVTEETGLSGLAWRQLGAYGRPDRDPRGHTVSVVFTARLAGGEPPPVRGGDDAAAARWWPLAELPPLGFDHARILADALAA